MQIQAPKQSRSRESYDRLLQAAEEILAQKSFEAATVQEIAARAGYTVGAYYARFQSKEALLGALEERLCELVESALHRLVDEAAVAQSLREIVTSSVELLAQVYRERGGLLISLRAAARQDAGLAKRLDAINRRVRQALVDALGRRLERSGPRRRLALETAVLIMTSALREMVLLRDFWPAEGTVPASSLEVELPRALTAYLESLP